MLLLSIDTSTDYLTLAVSRDDRVLARLHRRLPRMHSTLLVPSIAKVLKKAGVALKGLDGFCVSVGPGSFTGLRIGVTTVKALAYATSKPIVAVPTLDLIAANACERRGIICPVLDARKGKVYACLYRSDGRKLAKLSGYLLLPLPELETLLKKYDTVTVLGDILGKGEGWQPRAAVLARYGAELFRKKRFVKTEKLEPLYIYSRECDITGK